MLYSKLCSYTGKTELLMASLRVEKITDGDVENNDDVIHKFTSLRLDVSEISTSNGSNFMFSLGLFFFEELSELAYTSVIS